MAEGDTIWRLARRIGASLGGRQVAVRTPGRRRPSGLPASELDGLTLESAESRGKHLLLHFDGGLALHSHLGMNGGWHLYRRGERWRRSSGAAWIALAADGVEAVNFGGTSMRIVREAELPRDRRLARLGPDILDPAVDERRAASALAGAGGQVQVGEALLDQTVLAGVGNIFKSEGCFAAAVSPWRRVGELSAEELQAVAGSTRALMVAAAESGRQPKRIYRRAGMPCPRCRTRIRSRGQGDDARTTYWCPECQV